MASAIYNSLPTLTACLPQLRTADSSLSYVLKSPEPPQAFLDALLSLRDAVCRPDIIMEEVEAPRRIAPWSAALSLTTQAELHGYPLALGRFAVLHDPKEQPGWEGSFRIVGMVRGHIENELSTDPFLGRVAWDWMQDCLKNNDAEYQALTGTVTRELSETFGGLELRAYEAAIEIRASWTPQSSDLAPHLLGWLDTVGYCAGLEPVAPNLTTA